MTLDDEVHHLAASGGLDLPELGGGSTPDRWLALRDLARRNVSLGRLAEAHVDGHQILREAGVGHPAERVMGVWASEHPRWKVEAEHVGSAVRLRGSKAFCTGAGIVDDALVSTTTSQGPLLVLVPQELVDPARIDLSAWQAPALADTRTATIDLDGIELPPEAVVARPGWYLDRPGFWQGAIGPAACWGGAAAGLVDHALAHRPRGPHGTAHLGAMTAAAWDIEAVLVAAGRAVDADRCDASGAAHRLALIVRHLIDGRCETIQRAFERALGPRALVGDAEVAERHGALTIYRRQCHAEADLEALGALDPDVEPG